MAGSHRHAFALSKGIAGIGAASLRCGVHDSCVGSSYAGSERNRLGMSLVVFGVVHDKVHGAVLRRSSRQCSRCSFNTTSPLLSIVLPGSHLLNTFWKWFRCRNLFVRSGIPPNPHVQADGQLGDGCICSIKKVPLGKPRISAIAFCNVQHNACCQDIDGSVKPGCQASSRPC